MKADCRPPLAIAARLATDPFDATAVATRPGTPHDPPSAQAREPGGLEMALAIRPPIGKKGPAVPPVPMRKNVMACCAAAGRALRVMPQGEDRPPSSTCPR